MSSRRNCVGDREGLGPLTCGDRDRSRVVHLSPSMVLVREWISLAPHLGVVPRALEYGAANGCSHSWHVMRSLRTKGRIPQLNCCRGPRASRLPTGSYSRIAISEVGVFLSLVIVARAESDSW